MKTTVLARTALLTLAFVASSCMRDNEASVFIHDVCAFPDAEDCSGSSGTCDRIIVGTPWMFLSFPDDSTNYMELWIQYDNQLPDNADASSGHTNTNVAQADHYEMSFEAPTLGISIPVASVPSSTTIPSDGSTVDIARVVPIETAEFLRDNWPSSAPASALLNIKMKLKGSYLSGSAFETGEFPITVEVFNEPFPGYSCPEGQVLTAVCHHSGQSASVLCEEPSGG